MDKLYEALKRLLPDDTVREVTGAIQDILTETVREKDMEFNEKLEDAYTQLSAEKEKAERVGLEGYQQAYAIINDLRNRIEMVKAQKDKEMYEGFTEAYEMIKAERAKVNSISSEVYEEYDGKFDSMNKFYVDKIHEFLRTKGPEIYEQARRDAMNDPRTFEHKVAMDKIVDIVGGYISDEDQIYATSSKLDEAHKKIDELKSQIKLMEGRNINLSHQNTKLNEQLRHSVNVINENRSYARKNRKGQQATGRGHKVMLENDDVIITEHNNPTKNVREENTLVESLHIDKKTLNLLAGTIKGN